MTLEQVWFMEAHELGDSFDDIDHMLNYPTCGTYIGLWDLLFEVEESPEYFTLHQIETVRKLGEWLLGCNVDPAKTKVLVRF